MPDQDKLLRAIDAAENNSYGSEDDSELESQRARAIDYYHGKNVDPAPQGRSQVVDRSVFETIQWILPSLCRIFANGDDIVELVPFGPEDEAQAKQESDYLNYLVTQKNRWFDICLTWFQDALETKNSYCLAFMDESLQVEKEKYKRQSEEQVALLTQETGVEVVSFDEYPDEEAEPIPVQDPISGEIFFQPVMLYDIEIKRSKPKKKLCFRVLPPERCKIAESTPSHTLDECDYFEYWEYKTISQLRSEGFDIPDDIASDDDIDNEEDDARDQFGEELDHDEDWQAEPAMKRVRARMIWIRHDYDEDGIAEMQRVLRVGQRILYREEECRIPVASIVPFPNPHRHMGLSISDIVKDIQRIKTAILRGGLDNLYLANNPRTVINDQINLDDMLVSRPGGVVRSEGDTPVQENYSIIATPNVFPQAMEGLEYMDRIRESRTGVSRQFAGIENDTLLEAKSATEASQLSTMAAQRVEQIARIFASGVECLFSMAHELVLKHGHKNDVVKLRGQWVEINPSTWKTGRDMRIVVGYGAGNKDALASRMLKVLSLQKEAMSGGLRIASEQNIYQAVIEYTKASDFTAPQRFWTDPAQLPPPEPQPSEGEIFAQTEREKLQSSEKEKLADLQQREQESVRKTALDEYRANLDAEVKITLEQLKQNGTADTETLRARLRDAPSDIEQRLSFASEQISAVDNAQRNQSETLTQLIARMEAVVQDLEAPREVVRDKSGKITGVKINGKLREIKRDKSGKVVGA